MTDDPRALVRRITGGGRPRVVVIGDALLDRWWAGGVERLSREAPAPVVRLAERADVPGGAANTAVNLTALGAEVALVGAVGDDAGGDALVALLEAAGVDTGFLVRVPGHATTVKTRIAGGGQVLVRFDEGDPVGPDACARVAAAALAATRDADAELVCDYGIGSAGPAVRDALAARTTRPPVTVVDAHDLAPWAAVAPTAVTPNAGETERLLGTPLGADRVASAVLLRDELLSASGAAGVVVTLDRDGTVVHAPDGTARTIAHPAPDAMANGAGDTFAAALTVALAGGESLSAAAAFAQLAADVVVKQPGTSVCSTDALVASLEGPARVLDHDRLAAALDAHRRAGRRIVFTNGCFDVVHVGHITSLKQAKQLGDVLVVAVNDDESVRRLKGPGRPLNRAADRAGVLAELASVDYVTIFDSDTAIPLLERFRPDVYAKGGDYTPEMLRETATVEAYGGTVQILGYVSAHSTSGIIARSRAVPEGTAAG